MQYTTYNANVNSADYRASRAAPTLTVAQKIALLERSIARLEAAGLGADTYRAQLAKLTEAR